MDDIDFTDDDDDEWNQATQAIIDSLLIHLKIIMRMPINYKIYFIFILNYLIPNFG
jgi:hypothetical protein